MNQRSDKGLNIPYPLRVLDIDSMGRGVCRLNDGRVAFVPFACIDEEIIISIAEQKKNYVIARLEEIRSASDSRVSPICEAFGRCGGCAFQHVDYSTQLKYKTDIVKSQLRKIGGLDDVLVNTCRPSPNIYNYRNKAVLRFEENKGRLEYGFFEERTNKLIPISTCHICSEGINTAAKTIRDFLENSSIKSKVRSAMIRELGGGVQITFESERIATPDVEKLRRELLNRFKSNGIFKLTRDGRGRTIIRHLLGEKELLGNANGIDFSVSPSAFLQINSSVAEDLYIAAQRLLGDGGDDIVIDAYSGIGILSTMLSKKAHQVYAIEIVKEASASAKAIALRNNIDNLKVITGDCAVEVPNILQQIRERDANRQLSVLLDPPRKGCSVEVINSILKSRPNRIVYISCDSATFARDVKLLSQEYEVQSVTPFDMFPHTSDLEILSSLKLRG